MRPRAKKRATEPKELKEAIGTRGRGIPGVEVCTNQRSALWCSVCAAFIVLTKNAISRLIKNVVQVVDAQLLTLKKQNPVPCHLVTYSG
jgi:hypothetical protein